jgi:3-methyladenine DNA glycosylase AlkD
MNPAQKQIRKLKNEDYAQKALYYFKTGEGEYGEGDQFLGVRTPNIRLIAKENINLPLSKVTELVESKWHEERLLALFILVYRYTVLKKSNDKEATKLFSYYLKQFKYINNWDLVDTTCHKIIGPELIDKERKILYKWAKSKDLWTRRISMMTTYYFIKRDDYTDTLKLAEILLNDKEDLIHKVVGWMLREIGKRDKQVEDKFLKKHYKTMPRTMLRYAIEKYPEVERKKYLKGLF